MRFRRVWRWPKDLSSFIEEKCEGFTVHVCSGRSSVGDLRLDKYTRCDLKRDMYATKLPDDYADCVICDPPYGIPYTKRLTLHYELRRILRAGGRLIFKAPWVPRIPGLKEEECWILLPTNPPANVSILSVFRKIQATLKVQREDAS